MLGLNAEQVHGPCTQGASTPAGTQLWIETSTGCSPAFTVPACTPRKTGPESQLDPGGSNAPVYTPPAAIEDDIEGTGNGCILVYTDDCSGSNPLIAALTEKGLAYTNYFQSPYAFESIVAANAFKVILIDHACYNDFSYVWDDLVAAYQGGACVGIGSYDWDGSDDVSGAVSTFLSLGGAANSQDIQTQGTVTVWNPSPLFAGLPSALSPSQNYYLDEGDSWTYATAEAGWTSTPQQGEGAIVVGPKLVLLGFLPDQLSPDDGKRLWRNVIDFLTTGGPIPVLPTSWGRVKQLYR